MKCKNCYTEIYWESEWFHWDSTNCDSPEPVDVTACFNELTKDSAFRALTDPIQWMIAVSVANFPDEFLNHESFKDYAKFLLDMHVAWGVEK